MLEAIGEDGKIRTLGKELVKFPVEPSFAKSLLASCFVSRHCTSDVSKLLAVLSTESVWTGVSKLDHDRQKQFFRAKETFKEPLSDHYSLVRIFNAWRGKLDQGYSAAQQWCHDNCLQHRALLMAKSIDSQLREYVDKVDLDRIARYFTKFRSAWDTDRSAQLRFALAQGFFMNTCRKVSHMQKKEGGTVYLSVADGTFVKSDRDASSVDSSDYVIYT